LKQLLYILFFFFCAQAYATHNRAGEITYRHVSGLTYEITVVTYVFEPSPAERPVLGVFWGDGTPHDSIPRISQINLGNNIEKNVYIGEHTYTGPSPAPYIIHVEDPNRNAGILNIPNSVSTIFYIETELYINPFIGVNNSPTLLNPPIDNACVFVPFTHNPGAWDPDGDSLYYTLQESKKEAGQFIPGYSFPAASNSLSVNAATGELIWDSPMQQGEFNLSILIEEFRNGHKIGSVLRDMQITVGNCSHTPPTITGISDTCIIAGDTLAFNIFATDDTPPITLTANGGPFMASSSPAQFQSTLPSAAVTGAFEWETNCSHVQKGSYLVSFKATDSGNLIGEPILTDFHSTFIKVIAPKPENLTTVVLSNGINLTWNKTKCGQASGYRIYRRNGPSGWTPSYCEIGVPAYTGFQLIAQTNSINDTTFNDNNNGIGLVHGQDYCYRVIAFYPDGAESKASDEVCNQLKRDVPIITNVSVDSTSSSFGKIFVQWAPPTEHNTLLFPGPYRYLIYRGQQTTTNMILIDSTATFNDTTYNDSLLNTQDYQYYYRIDMYNLTGGTRVLMGNSTIPSSIYLNLIPSDNQITLQWSESVPWTNTEHIIYKQNPTTLVFDSLDITTGTNYIDTALINLTTHCYQVKSRGAYSVTNILNPIVNYSQFNCAQPIDNIVPCPPTLSVMSACELQQNTLLWQNDALCADDVLQFNIYKKDATSNDYNLIESFPYTADSTVFDNLFSVAGCYVITGVDSVGNESEFSDSVCVDNCPVYELPNIFTPGNDGKNDLFTPLPYRFVESVDIKIYDRWGVLVFETSDPDVLWDGNHLASKKEANDGVYFYVCTVNEIYLEGIKPRVIKGFVHLLRNKESNL